MNIETRVTPSRRCGLRRPGGLYLVANGPAQFCGKLPAELSVCPCCHHGIKPSRAWTWVNATLLLAAAPCKAPKCVGCPMLQPGLGMAGLLWVGTCFYPSPQSWTEEALAFGVSRRIPALPVNFKLGQTWVLLGHRQAITRFEPFRSPSGDTGAIVPVQLPGVFHAFKPTAVEYVVTGRETPEELAKFADRGITPVIDKLPATGDLSLDSSGPHGSNPIAAVPSQG